MKNLSMSLNTKLEVAIEILSAKIANVSNAGYTTDDDEMKILIDERNKMYAGDEKVIDKIIEI